MVERFADIQLLRYEVPGFKSLPLRQKLLVYDLAEAALLGRDILWDQNSQYGLLIRRILEDIYIHYDGPENSSDWQAFKVYMKRVWFSNGIHHHYSYQKFEPGFSKAFLKERLKTTDNRLSRLISAPRCKSIQELTTDKIVDIIFNPEVMPKRVNQADGEDL